MAVKHFCDRCGKEIISLEIITKVCRSGNDKDISVSQELEIYGRKEKKYELCGSCFNELNEWLKGSTNESIK